MGYLCISLFKEVNITRPKSRRDTKCFSSPKQKVDYLLRQCEWNDENKLINEYYIPNTQIQIAKALNAHDSWDYETEYTVLINGNLFQQAKQALLHFLLPKLFQSKVFHIIIRPIRS
jgi:hypothetical protein